MLNFFLTCSDRSTVDWILNCNSKSILSFIHSKLSIITFGTLELADYFYKESGLLTHISKFNNNNNTIGDDILLMIYLHVWFNAIKQSDFKTIKYIESLDIGTLYINSNKSIERYLSFHTAIKFVEHYNEIGWYGFNEDGIRSFILSIARASVFYFYDQDNQKSPFLDFKNNNELVVPTLIRAVKCADEDVINILLNSSVINYCSTINYDKSKLVQDLNDTDNYLFYLKSIEIYQDYQNDEDLKIDILLKLISNIVLYKSNDDKNICNLIIDNQSLNDLKSIIVNHLFKILIQMKDITMVQVKEVYKLFQQHSIIVEHSIYHSFYYLHIKDIKFTSYILCQHVGSLFYQNGHGNGVYDCSDSIKTDALEDYLKPSDFTLESIDSLPFDTVLEMIVNGLSTLLEKYQYEDTVEVYQEEYFYNIKNYQLNKELEFYLVIRKVDLFFKKLGDIKCELDYENINNNYNINNSTSPTLFTTGSILYDSPSSTLLPNSTLFNNSHDDEDENLSHYVPSKLFNKFNNLEFQHIEIVAYSYKFSAKLLKYIFTIMNIDEIKRVIKFKYYQTSFQNDLLVQAIKSGRLDIIKLLLDNFDITFTDSFYHSLFSINDDESDHDTSSFLTTESLSFIFKNYFKLVQYPCKFKLMDTKSEFKSFKFVFLQLLHDHFNTTTEEYKNQYQQFISPSTSTELKMKILDQSYEIIESDFVNHLIDTEDLLYCIENGYFESEIVQKNKLLLEIYQTDEYQQLFINLFKIKQPQLQKQFQELEEKQHQIEPLHHCCNCNYNELERNIFLSAFIKGDIQLCELILSYYPNYKFMITKVSITETIKNNNIHIINHFLNNHKTMFNNNENSDLMNHLKSQLNNHKDYKHINKTK